MLTVAYDPPVHIFSAVLAAQQLISSVASSLSGHVFYGFLRLYDCER